MDEGRVRKFCYDIQIQELVTKLFDTNGFYWSAAAIFLNYFRTLKHVRKVFKLLSRNLTIVRKKEFSPIADQELKTINRHRRSQVLSAALKPGPLHDTNFDWPNP
jgi:hypothetical protein